MRKVNTYDVERITQRVNGKINIKPYRKKDVKEKLAKIEDIEEEFGIDIIEFFEHYKHTGVLRW